MQTAPLRSTVIPSPAVLRFLKIQAESLHFLSTTKGPASQTLPTTTRRSYRTDHQAQTLQKSSELKSWRCSTGSHYTGGAGLALRNSSSPWPSKSRLSDSPSCHEGLKITTARTFGQRRFCQSSRRREWSSWLPHRQKAVKPLQPDDLPPIPGFLDDNAVLGRVIKPTNELKLRCTEFDENGNVTLVNGEFKKSELIAKYGLLPRDLRKIDSSLLPHILVRPSAILINLLHIRCLIKYNRVLVFDAYGSTDSYTQSVFMYDLEGKLRQREQRNPNSLPYEFRALEAVLISVTAGLESEFEGVREPVVRVLRELEEDIDRDKLRHLLIYSKKLGTFEQQARLVRDAIDDLLEEDDDLAGMYLTEKAAGKGRGEDDYHTEVEMLLESYHKVADEIVQVSGNLVSNIRNTEEIVKAILDANRNSLMLLELKFSIYTLGIGAGTFIAALYGMNLKNFIEESDLGFGGVSVTCAIFTMVGVMYGMQKLRRVQRLSMWGEGGRLKKGREGKEELGKGELEGSGAAEAGAGVEG